MSDDRRDDESLDAGRLPLAQRISRWIETRLGYEFLCHDCNNATRIGVAPRRSGCLGHCGLTNRQRAEEYRMGSDAYTPRIRNRYTIGGGAMD